MSRVIIIIITTIIITRRIKTSTPNFTCSQQGVGRGRGAKGKQTMKVLYSRARVCVYTEWSRAIYCWHSFLQAKSKKRSLYITYTKTYHQPMTVPELIAV